MRVLQGRAGRPVRAGPHAREPRRLPRPRRRVHGRLRRRQGEGRRGPRRRDLGAPERHDQVRRRAEDGRQGLARHDARRARQVPVAGRREGARTDGRRRRDPQGDEDGRRRLVSAGRLRGRCEVVRGAVPRGGRRARQLHARVHRARAVLAEPLRGEGPADHRRRHQVPGRRDDHAPRAHVALPRARRSSRQDDAAERRRQLGLPQHARARAPGVEEDLEDERGHLDARLRPRRAERPCRTVGLRAVAHGPQVGLHPYGGLRFRRRAAERRAEARGLGFAELRRHRHRRGAHREARAEQWRLRRADRAERLPHEVADAADRRRRGVRADRGVHPRERADGFTRRRRLTVELRSARSLSSRERAELFTAAYEGYVVPMHVDQASLEWMEKTFDVDLDASRVAFRNGRAVGLANLAVRGADAWIGGVGVVTDARRDGIGEKLMDAVHEEARSRSVDRVWLEVIDANAGAIALYEKLGYDRAQDVEVWTLPAEKRVLPGREVAAEEAKALLPERHEPWQRADGTLAHYDDVRGFVTDDGAMLFCVRKTAQLQQYAGRPEPLLSALRSFADVYVLNLPADDPAAAVLRELGGAVTVRQHEMVLAL